ncbi:hypothetical protein C8Q72DRAFT_982195, partial [Fomitopsis betulina]
TNVIAPAFLGGLYLPLLGRGARTTNREREPEQRRQHRPGLRAAIPDACAHEGGAEYAVHRAISRRRLSLVSKVTASVDKELPW